MRTRTLITAAVAAVATTGAGLAGTATAATPNACEGVSGCTTISRADIDGDGRADSTGISARMLDDGRERVTVRTVTADGERLRTNTDSDRPLGAEARHRGTARIDGEPGHELVITDTRGAHTVRSRVITYRDGRLTTLTDPFHEWRWVTDGSVWSSYGYRRVNESSLGVQMYVSEAISENHDGRFDQTLLRSRWDEGGERWVKVKKLERRVGTDTIRVYGGWHINWMSPGI